MRSVLLRRIFVLVFFAVALCSILTYGLYTYIAEQEFSKMIAIDLEPRAQRIADAYASVVQDNSKENREIFLYTFYGVDDSAWGGRLRIYDAQSRTFIKPGARTRKSTIRKNNIQPVRDFSKKNGEESEYSFFQKISDNTKYHIDMHFKKIEQNYVSSSENELLQALIPELDRVLLGQNVQANFTVQDSQDGYLVVGVPVELDEKIIGAVFFAKPFLELRTAQNGLNRTLLLSFLAVAVVMLVPCLIVARNITLPINKMRDISLSMAQGNFDVKIDFKEKGEIGELASSINYLSSKLSSTISDLVVERNRLREIMDGLNEGIIAVDSNFIITHHNSAICELYNKNTPPKNSDIFADYFSESLHGDFIHCIENSETVFQKTVISKKIFRIVINPLKNQDDTIVGAVGLIRDVTESERLEQTRKDYVANVSHELKTPVATIRAMAETLSDNLVKSEADRSRYYLNIVRESMRLSRLISDLLELSRLQSSNTAFEKTFFDFKTFIESATQTLSVLIDDMDLALKLEIDEKIKLTFGNKDRLQQVLVILLDNAIKYSPEGSKILLKAKFEKQRIVLSVIDEGEGISPADIEHIFDRFYKADRSRCSSGVGLGLSIAKELIDQMDEKIGVSSKLGEGTNFFFTISTEKPTDL